MNRKDTTAIISLSTALIAHLDAIEARWTGMHMELLARFDRLDEAVAGIRMELAVHRHEDES
jgi:hypothetical protein